MKILLFGNSLNGMLNFRWDIIKYLADQQHQVFIVSPIEIKDSENKYEHKNIFFLNINFCRSFNLLKDFLTLLHYKKYIKKINPDVIFTYSLKASLLSMLINWKIPSFYFITGIGSSLISQYRFFVEKILYLLTCTKKMLLKHKDYFIFLNKDDLDYFIKKKLCGKTSTIIFPGEGINLNSFKFLPIKDNKKPIAFLFIGRLIRDKGILELIDACEQLQNKQINFTCTAIAPLDLSNPSSLHAMNLDNFKQVGINYIAYVADVRPYIDNCDVVVLPSYSEGLPRVLLESMAIGRPIITADVPGCRELVKNHENGILVKPKHVDDLYNAMVSMAKKDKIELNMLGFAGYERVKEKYSISSVINSYQKLLDNIINTK